MVSTRSFQTSLATRKLKDYLLAEWCHKCASLRTTEEKFVKLLYKNRFIQISRECKFSFFPDIFAPHGKKQ